MTKFVVLTVWPSLTLKGSLQMSKSILTASAAVSLIGALITSQAHAQSAGGADAEIALLKQQLRLMEQKLDKVQRQTTANTAAAATANEKVTSIANAKATGNFPVKGLMPASGVVASMPNNRPTFCTADGQNCVAITSRLHFDAGGYDYHPNSRFTSPQRLDDGVNARRARIGVIGKFMGDWNYALIFDLGGSSDGYSGYAPGSLSGGGLSALQVASLSYTGFKPSGGQLVLEGGYLDVPYTLAEATSSNDLLFMERSSAANLAINIAGSDFRSAAGGRWFNDTLWFGAYATGPTSGAIHTASTTAPPGTSEQLGTVVRAAGQVLSGPGYSLHIGGDAEFLIQPPHNYTTATQTLTLSDRPELRIDPTPLISTGALANVSGPQVYSAEAAGTYGPLFVEGEYYWYNVDRNGSLALPLSSVKFSGGYVEASYVLTGETHTYNRATAAYNGILPANPFSLDKGGLGAWEIAGRVSTEISTTSSPRRMALLVDGRRSMRLA